MDSLTHLLVGHAMGAVATTISPVGGAVYWAALIGNSLPDIDIPISLMLRRGIKMHRTVTHTLPGAILLALLTTGGLHLFYPEAPLWPIFAWALMGNLVHLGMDCLNLFGARPFWPLNQKSVDLGILHILDPLLLAALGLPTILGALGLISTATVALSFFAIPLYVVYRISVARQLSRQLNRLDLLRARVIPWFTGWRYVLETRSGIEFGTWNRGERKPLTVWPKVESPLVQASLADPAVASFLSSAEYPFAAVEEDDEGHSVVWGDAIRQVRADYRPLRVRVYESYR